MLCTCLPLIHSSKSHYAFGRLPPFSLILLATISIYGNQRIEYLLNRPVFLIQMDVLSEVLRVVKLEGAFFFNGEFSAPWCLRNSGWTGLAPYLSPESGHLIIYHFLTEGRRTRGCRKDSAKSCPPGISLSSRMGAPTCWVMAPEKHAKQP